MKFKTVYNSVKNVPYISDDNAAQLYQFIIKNKPQHILELGIAHGTASCYIAAALDEIGKGKLTCVDLIEVKDTFQPSIETQLKALHLESYVTIHRMTSGYNWFLHNEIKSCSDTTDNICTPKYDLIIIDGPKNWTIDSSSFFLSDKLLKEEGWIIWDDYMWSYKDDGDQDATDDISHRSLSKEELSIPHIKEIFHLLVMQHPDYTNFIIQDEGDWAWAQKRSNTALKNIHYTTSRSIKSVIKQTLKRIARR